MVGFWMLRKKKMINLCCNLLKKFFTPFREELDINLIGIFQKFKRVLVPFGGTDEEWFKLLDDSEFWGSFASVLLYSLLIVWHQLKVVSWVFWIWIVGSISIWFLSKLFGSNLTFSQLLSCIGYSVLPLNLTVLVLMISQNFIHNYFIVFLKLFATIWSSYSCCKFLIYNDTIKEKRWMMNYPIWLLFIYLITFHSGV
jgi:hypothetical protein